MTRAGPWPQAERASSTRHASDRAQAESPLARAVIRGRNWDKTFLPRGRILSPAPLGVKGFDAVGARPGPGPRSPWERVRRPFGETSGRSTSRGYAGREVAGAG